MKKFFSFILIWIVFLGAVFAIYFGTQSSSRPTADARRTAERTDRRSDSRLERRPSFSSVNDFVYQLQNIDLAAIGETAFDLVVIDFSIDENTLFTAAQINALKNSPGGPKLVLAYMSIGEAENYRWYWNDSWDANNDGTPDPGAPAWLGPSNPDWPGNYKVKYWNQAWQRIIFGTSNSYLNKIMAAGFDGVYLDIIDAYEYWGAEGGEIAMQEAQRKMADFVKAIARYARSRKGSNFGIFANNGLELAAYSDYVRVVTGIGSESVWYVEDTPQPEEGTNYVLSKLDIFKAAGKLIMVMDYPSQQELIDDFYAKALAKGYVPYATNRVLDRITINPGHEPD